MRATTLLQEQRRLPEIFICSILSINTTNPLSTVHLTLIEKKKAWFLSSQVRTALKNMIEYTNRCMLIRHGAEVVLAGHPTCCLFVEDCYELAD